MLSELQYVIALTPFGKGGKHSPSRNLGIVRGLCQATRIASNKDKAVFDGNFCRRSNKGDAHTANPSASKSHGDLWRQGSNTWQTPAVNTGFPV